MIPVRPPRVFQARLLWFLWSRSLRGPLLPSQKFRTFQFRTFQICRHRLNLFIAV
jgi:hypothetical protein